MGLLTTVHAQTTVAWTAKFIATPPVLGENPTLAKFGGAVAVRGDTIAIGETGFDIPPHDDVGAMYVFERTGSAWQLTPRCTSINPFTSDGLGRSVAIGSTSGGEMIFAGAPGRHVIPTMSSGTNAGSVFVFTRTPSGWLQSQELRSPTPTMDEHFGWSIAVDGDRLVVGAPGPGVNLPNPSTGSPGSVYVFDLTPSGWSLSVPALAYSAGLPGDAFGCAVALDRDLLAVGALHDDTAGGVDSGSVIPFHLSAGTWVEEAPLDLAASAGTQGGAEFGVAVALSGSTLAIGAQQEDTSTSQTGAVHLYSRVGASWRNPTTLLPTNLLPGDWFGSGVALDGTRLAVASLLADNPEPDSGAAYLFELIGGNWVETQLHAVDSEWPVSGTQTDRAAIALSVDTILVGAPQVRRPPLSASDGTYPYAGAAYLFTPPVASPGTSFCGGDVSGGPCPCANFGSLGEGCANSSGHGVEIDALGSSSASTDDLVISATHVMPGLLGESAVLLAGTTIVSGVVFGDGLRCIGGTLHRLGTHNLGNNATGEEAWGPGLRAQGGWSSGTTRHFQLLYRNSATFCTTDTFNVSQALSVSFAP
jgi:hypothetical protein